MNQSLPCPRQYFNRKVYCVALLPREPSAMLASLLGSACHSPLADPGRARMAWCTLRPWLWVMVREMGITTVLRPKSQSNDDHHTSPGP